MLKTNEQGRSMIEMLGVLAIIGVLSVGGIAGYSKAMNKFKTNKLTDQVSMIVTNIRTLYAQQTTYGGLNNKNAISMGVIPDEMGTDTGTGLLTNPFNGPVFVGSGTAGGSMAGGNDAGDTRAFVVEVGGISREACVALAVNDWGSGSASGLIAIKAQGEAKSPTSNASLNGSTVEKVADDKSMKVGCNGVANSIACPGSAKQPVPMIVSQAATACKCGTYNNCTLTWKYY